MPKQEGQKSKLLTLLRILEQKTDEEHLLNVPQLVELLEQQDILAERKSIYSDIDTLRSLGYDIQLRRGRGGGYWLASRTFELSELKLLVDAVQASKVVSARTSSKLIHKLEALCSDYEGTQLQRQVYVDGRPKSDSHTLLYSIDALHSAINAGRMVRFRYKVAISRSRRPACIATANLPILKSYCSATASTPGRCRWSTSSVENTSPRRCLPRWRTIPSPSGPSTRPLSGCASPGISAIPPANTLTRRAGIALWSGRLRWGCRFRCCDLFRALWDAQAQCAGDDRADCVSVPGPDAVLSVRRGDRQRFARAVIKCVVSGQNMHAEAVHSEASFLSCSALRTASSIVPTL